MDKYTNYSALSASEKQDADFRIRSRTCGGKPAIIAPHGGGIEPGTSELALAIAGEDLSFYLFEGLKKSGNEDLHITSARFDEPTGNEIVKAAGWVIALHGEASDDEKVYIGGLDKALIAKLQSALTEAGFEVARHASPELQGRDTANICNRGKSGVGVQLELPKGLREQFFSSLKAKGRTERTGAFCRFVAAVRLALSDAP